MPSSDVLTPTDPALESAKAAEKDEVKGYFETTGFDRWNRIYSDSPEVNRVQRNIRIGHQKTVDNVLAWLGEQGNLGGRSFCDAGCGVGSLSLPLAQLGAVQLLRGHASRHKQIAVDGWTAAAVSEALLADQPRSKAINREK